MSSRSSHLPYWLVVAGFVVGQLLYTWVGIRFDAGLVTFFAQFLDPSLLRERLAESVLYLHAQPPLFNFLTGLALKVAPGDASGVLSAFFHLVGLGTTLAIFDALVNLKLARWLAAAVALGISVTPQFVFFEHQYFYPHLNVFFVVAAGACLLRSGAQPNRWMGAGAWLLALLVLNRSLFHPAFLLLAALGSMALCRPAMAVAKRFAGPLLVVGAFMLKNLVLFGFFGLSSWGGMSLHRAVHSYLGDARVNEEVAAGNITALSQTREFSSGEIYASVLGLSLEQENRGIPALDQTGKSTPSINPVNYNHWAFVPASRAYSQNAMVLIRRYPLDYVVAVFTRGWDLFFNHPTSGDFMEMNTRPFPGLYAFGNLLEQSALAWWFLVIGLAMALVRTVRQHGVDGSRYFHVYAFGTFLWVLLIGLVAEYGENYRFRYKILWLAVVVAMGGWRDLVLRIRAWLHTTDSAVSGS